MNSFLRALHPKLPAHANFNPRDRSHVIFVNFSARFSSPHCGHPLPPVPLTLATSCRRLGSLLDDVVFRLALRAVPVLLLGGHVLHLEALHAVAAVALVADQGVLGVVLGSTHCASTLLAFF